MVFYKTISTEPVASIISGKINSKLDEGQKVFWIVTGGSSIKVEAMASRLLKSQNLNNLSVTLTDERYGPVGHPESNWHQLVQAGFVLPNSQLLPILQGEDRQNSTKEFARNLTETFSWCDYSLGIFGIGPDGHVAGVLPGTPSINSQEMAISYDDREISNESPAGVLRGFDRITMTTRAVAKLDEAIVCAFGEAKRLWLDILEKDLPVEQNPAQALKQAAKLSIYNDYKGQPL